MILLYFACVTLLHALSWFFGLWHLLSKLVRVTHTSGKTATHLFFDTLLLRFLPPSSCNSTIQLNWTDNAPNEGKKWCFVNDTQAHVKLPTRGRRASYLEGSRKLKVCARLYANIFSAVESFTVLVDTLCKFFLDIENHSTISSRW